MEKKYLLGYDIGTSSVKASVVDAATGKTVASAQYPDQEAPIISKEAGWQSKNLRCGGTSCVPQLSVSVRKSVENPHWRQSQR